MAFGGQRPRHLEMRAIGRLSYNVPKGSKYGYCLAEGK